MDWLYNISMGWLPGLRQAGAKRLVSLLADPSQAQQAAASLIRMGAGAVPALVEAILSRSPGMPAAGDQVLAHIGKPALPALIQTLQQAHPLVRARAALILGQIKDPAALPALREALRSEFFTVRAAAAAALGEIGDRESLDSLLQSMKDPEAVVRASAVLAVGAFGLPGTFKSIASLLLEDPRTEVRQAAARALGRTQNPAALPLLMEALHDSFWWYEREPAAADLLNAIQAMGEPAILPLIESLNDPEGTIRRFSACLLGKMHATQAMDALGMALYDLHFEVGQTAARALGRMGPESLRVLGLAAGHPEPNIRQHAALGLGQIDHPRSAELLLELLEDSEKSVRAQAIPGLAAQKDPLALAALMQLAGDRSDRELQSLAKEALHSLNLDA